MSAQEDKATSVRTRLLHLAKARGENFNLILTRYSIERLLFRLTQTNHADRFVLKGAMLYFLWDEKTVRPTKDLDLAGFGKIDEQELRMIFRDVCLLMIPTMPSALMRIPWLLKKFVRAKPMKVSG